MKLPDSILHPNHPSYGCDQAWFVFGVMNDSGDITRVLIVEAKNTWQVQVLERVSNKDNKVNPHCELMTVGRQCSSVGTRSQRAVEVTYVDFVLDIVEPSRLTEDVFISGTFDRSLSSDERAYATTKLDKLIEQGDADDELSVLETPMREAPSQPVNNWLGEHYARPAAKSAPYEVETSANHHRVVAALLDLGFKKPQVSKVMAELDMSGTIEDSIKAALQKMCA